MSGIPSPSTKPSVSLVRQIDNVEREIRRRNRVFPLLVAQGRMAPPQAVSELAEMEAVLATLQACNKE